MAIGVYRAGFASMAQFFLGLLERHGVCDIWLVIGSLCPPSARHSAPIYSLGWSRASAAAAP
jgi:hypothetical protein